MAARHGDAALYEKLHQAARAKKDQTERARMFRAMGALRQPEAVKAALGMLLTEEFDARETVFPILMGTLETPEVRPLSYAFVKERFEPLVARLPRDFGAGLPMVGSSLCDEEHQAEVASFFGERAHRFTGGPRRLAQALEGMKLCSTFRKAQAPAVEAFLSAPGKAGGPPAAK